MQECACIMEVNTISSQNLTFIIDSDKNWQLETFWNCFNLSCSSGGRRPITNIITLLLDSFISICVGKQERSRFSALKQIKSVSEELIGKKKFKSIIKLSSIATNWGLCKFPCKVVLNVKRKGSEVQFVVSLASQTYSISSIFSVFGGKYPYTS